MYEYPKEATELSPAISEPQLWIQTLDKFIEAQQQETASLYKPSSKKLVKIDDLIKQDIDGFTISSSARPFQTCSQLHVQCSSWPGEQGDFSWSQYQVVF